MHVTTVPSLVNLIIIGASQSEPRPTMIIHMRELLCNEVLDQIRQMDMNAIGKGSSTQRAHDLHVALAS